MAVDRIPDVFEEIFLDFPLSLRLCGAWGALTTPLPGVRMAVEPGQSPSSLF